MAQSTNPSRIKITALYRAVITAATDRSSFVGSTYTAYVSLTGNFDSGIHMTVLNGPSSVKATHTSHIQVACYRAVRQGKIANDSGIIQSSDKSLIIAS